MDFDVQQTIRAESSAELRLLTELPQQQSQMILELQNLAAMQLQQNQQMRLCFERIMSQMVQGHANKEADSVRKQSKINEIATASKDIPQPFSASIEVFPDGPERMPHLDMRRIPKSIHQLRKLSAQPDETNRRCEVNDFLRKNKQQQVVNSGRNRMVRAKMSNVTANKNSVVFRECSTAHSYEECGKEFSHKCQMITHSRIHSGAKKFKCQLCEAAFKQKHHLSDHLLIHMNERPFVCDICQRSFRRKCGLVPHMRIHSGLKPYKCNVCQKTFRYKPTLNSHRKSSHRW